MMDARVTAGGGPPSKSPDPAGFQGFVLVSHSFLYLVIESDTEVEG